MSYAILRAAKLTTWGNVSSSGGHNWRERETPNADPLRTPGNRSKGAHSAAELVKRMKARMPAKVRKNAVLGIEYFIGASPEWFTSQSANRRDEYLDAAEVWLRERHGAENVIAVTRHYDETSPHLCAYVVPIDPDTGRLNASRFLDGVKKLSEMQTEFASQVGARFDLERGIEGSRAKHERVERFYGILNRPSDDVQLPTSGGKPPADPPAPSRGDHLSAALGQKTAASKAQAQHQAELKRQIEEARLATAALTRKLQLTQVKAMQHDADRAAHRARGRAFDNLKARATVAREISLERVLEALGCEADPKDRKNWRTPAGRLTVQGSKFFAHDAGKGGGGAIDLVALLEGVQPKEAIGWLSRQFDTGEVLGEMAARARETVAAAVAEPPPPFEAPKPSPDRWPVVRRYLTQTRKIPEELVDQMHAEQRVYADERANAVFVLQGGAGVELRGTGPSPFHGVRGLKRMFVLRSLGERVVAFVESAIDALSLRALGFKGVIASTTGSQVKAMQATAEDARAKGFRVVAAFDRDQPGEAMAAKLGQAERMRPQGKDWNEDLRNKPAPAAVAADEIEVEQQRIREQDT